MKTKDQIRSETRERIPKPANYQPHERLAEWEPAETRLSRDEFIRQVQPMHDRIVVRLLKEPQAGKIALTDAAPLIGGCRKAVVLKTGPGRWIPGEWSHVKIGHAVSVKFPGRYAGELPHETPVFGDLTPVYGWNWFCGYRRPVSVQAGQIVLIGNWVDLELEDIALCAEGDVRLSWPS